MKIKYKILEKINENPGLTLPELSKIFLKSKGNISIHLKNLENEELIKKYQIKDNKKNFKLHPTKKGKEQYLKSKLEKIWEFPKFSVNCKN